MFNDFLDFFSRPPPLRRQGIGTPTSLSFQVLTFAVTAMSSAVAWLYDAFERIKRAFTWAFRVLPPVPLPRMLVAPPRPALLGKLALVSCWASFLVATTAHADTGTASTGVSPSTLLLGLLGALGGGYALLKLGMHLAGKAADAGLDLGATSLKARLGSIAYFKAHPDELAIVCAFIDFVSGRIKLALATAETDVDSATGYSPALLKQILADEKAVALQSASAATVTTILTNAKLLAPGQSLASWLESELGHLLGNLLPKAPLGAAASTLANAGRISGQARPRLALMLAVLGALGMSYACSAAQKAAEKADAAVALQQLEACNSTAVQASLPAAEADLQPVLDGVEQVVLAGAETSPVVTAAAAAAHSLEGTYGAAVVSCAVQALAADAGKVFVRPADGGLSVASTDVAKLVARTKVAEAYLAAKLHKPAAKAGG